MTMQLLILNSTYHTDDFGIGKVIEKCLLYTECLESPALKCLHYVRPIIKLVCYHNRQYLLCNDKSQFVDLKTWKILSMENAVG